MKKITYLLLILSQCMFSQLILKKVVNAQELVSNLAGNAKNVRITNPKITQQKQTFATFNANLKYNNFMDSGIIMSTGLAKDAKGPNKQQNKTSHINFISDEDINIIAKRKGCYDTSLFEFDLISETDQIQFNYVFASEEYPEYVNKNVNDIFIFLVTNTQTGTSENIAILNGDKNTPITVDHINPSKNSNYYIPNAQFNKELLKNTENLQQIELAYTFQYDGFTTKLTATAKVKPYVTYHFKLGISDVGDHNFDSAIFLEANSLRSNGKKPELKEALTNFKDELSLDFDINFENNSANLKGNNSYLLLDNIIKALINNPTIFLKIIGHTDKNGTESNNLKLSLKRAKSVSNYLTKHGINPNRIIVEGLGDKQLKSNLNSENRRVEIIFKH